MNSHRDMEKSSRAPLIIIVIVPMALAFAAFLYFPTWHKDVPPDSAAMPDEADLIQKFLECEAFAVVGASNDLRKYGAKVFACYRQKGREVYPINPARDTVQGETAYPNLTSLPVKVEAVSIVTPPEVTEMVVEDASEAGVRYLWMQPGAQSERAITRAEELGMGVIAGGACLLVVLGYREE